MQAPGSLASVDALIESSLADTDLAIAAIAGHEDEAAMIAYADYGVPWHWSACQDDLGLRDIGSYKQSVGNGNCAAWMDNTTLVTAATLMSDMGPDAMTPLTVWDLVTVTRAVVCFEPLVSRHKSNSCNWLPSSVSSTLGPTSKMAVEMGIFSKSVTLTIWRSL